jgi:hypothetical protein
MLPSVGQDGTAETDSNDACVIIAVTLPDSGAPITLLVGKSRIR